MPNTLTILTHSTIPHTKTWKSDGTVLPREMGRYFTHKSVEVSNFSELANLLSSLEGQANSFLIRGRYVGDEIANALVDPDKPEGKVARNGDTFEDQSLNVCMIDADKYSPVCSDPVHEPEDAIKEFIEDALPDFFHGKSFYYQLSSSAGSEGNESILKAHIWFWLKEPLTSDQLKAWAKSIDLDGDNSVFNPVQIHYTAAPIFEDGIDDPVPNRSGLVQGELGDAVEFSEQAMRLCTSISNPSAPVRLSEKIGDDAFVKALHEQELYKSTHKNGTVYFECPFSDGHSQPSSETSTAYFPPHTNGFKNGAVKCFHDSCSHRTTADYFEKIGVMREIVLDAQDMMEVANWIVDSHYTIDGAITLLRMNDEWYRYSDVCYMRLNDEAMRSLLWRILSPLSRRDSKGDVVDYKPKPHDVSGISDALKAAIRRENIKPNTWTNDRPQSDCVSMKNGIFDIQSKKIEDHSPHFFTLNSLPFEYVDSGEPKEFITFLEDIFESDEETIHTVQEMFGYLLTAETSLQKMFMLLGPPRSGKGTLMHILNELLGTDNVISSSFSALANDFGLEPMRDKLVAILPDARLSKRTDAGIVTEKLLSISGEDYVIINAKHKAMTHARISARILIVSNEIPNLVDASRALAERFIYLETRKSYLGKEDVGLKDRLQKELPQIFLWALEGRERLQARGKFLQPTASKHISEDMYRLNNPIGAFIAECCDLGNSRYIGTSELYEAYCHWCEAVGHKYPKAVSSFGRDLKSVNRKITSSKKMEDGKRFNCYYGIALKEDIALEEYGIHAPFKDSDLDDDDL